VACGAALRRGASAVSPPAAAGSAAPSAAPRPSVLRFVVPPGAAAGDAFSCDVGGRDGASGVLHKVTVRVRVPAGKKPGDVFEASIGDRPGDAVEGSAPAATRRESTGADARDESACDEGGGEPSQSGSGFVATNGGGGHAVPVRLGRRTEASSSSVAPQIDEID
jgi:hypothetical protein